VTACAAAGHAAADRTAAAQAAIDFINANSVRAPAEQACRFLFEYVQGGPDAGNVAAGSLHRIVTFSTAMSDAALRLSADRRAIEGLGLVFDYETMNDNGHGRMARDSGDGQAQQSIVLQDAVPSSLSVADVTPPSASDASPASLDWLRGLLPPLPFVSLDRVAADYQGKGWSMDKSAGSCSLGDARMLRLRWNTAGGGSAEAHLLWRADPAGFERAFRTILATGKKQ
jgi:hypothetical protein